MIQHDDSELGPTEVFTGAMANIVARNTKTVRVIDAATFATLQFMYPTPATGVSPDAVSPETIASYPNGTILRFVKSFKLTSGSIKATYLT